MGRRPATQVHKTATRLMQGRLITEPPLWYKAVAKYPPMPTPARKPVQRSAFDTPIAAASSSGRPKVMPIVYLEDRVRHRFFLDHPFEAFRPKNLVEQRYVQREHPIQGLEWTRLRQHTRNPTPEDVIAFTVSLHTHHGLPLSQAYHTATQQYAALRSEHAIAARIAVEEAESYGAKFKGSEIERGFALEEHALKTWDEDGASNEDVIHALKKWRPVIEHEAGPYTQGSGYDKEAKAGKSPTYKTVADLQQAALALKAQNQARKPQDDPFTLAESS